MHRHLLIYLLFACLTSAAFAATTVVVNGKPVTLPVIDAAGKAYVDIVALMQMIGGKASYDAANGKLYINSASGAAPATSGGGGGNAASTGTAQLPGDNGVLGQVYTIRKDQPLYFSLKSAEYALEQVRMGGRTATPTADEKLLVLHFTVQNPLKTEQYVRWDSLRLTAVDATNVNHEGGYDWANPENGEAVSLSLKPAQTVSCYTVINVPAKGQIPKLMVLPANDNDGPVLRYDLRDVVKGLPAPIADPADASGATALDPIPAQFGAACPLKYFDATVEKVDYATQTIAEIDPPEEGRFLLATVLLKNDTGEDEYLRWDSVSPTLTGADGEELEYRTMIAATANREIAQNLKPGQELRVRLVFEVPKDSQPTTLSLKEEESHTFNFTLPKQ